MGELRGFLKYQRQEVGHRAVAERVRDFHEIDLPLTPEAVQQQAARCMNCGIPFCQGAGCPVVNSSRFQRPGLSGRKDACRLLHRTNSFPEITGRVCPAPCENSCTLNVNDNPVLIKHIEYQIVEKGFQEGWIVPQPPKVRTGKRVGVIGSGPAGLAAAQKLAGQATASWDEKDERPGGLMRYGNPTSSWPRALTIGVSTDAGRRLGVSCGVTAAKSSPYGISANASKPLLTMGADSPWILRFRAGVLTRPLAWSTSRRRTRSATANRWRAAIWFPPRTR
jgi:hypothetical protein